MRKSKHSPRVSTPVQIVKAELLRSTVGLLRVWGGWNRGQLPSDEEIQPFGTFQYVNLNKPPSVRGIDVTADNWLHNDLTKRPVPPLRPRP